tara:strand:- start:116 stop:217 length:102 start_codon:yes stop_codon:yes gene_type:complete
MTFEAAFVMFTLVVGPLLCAAAILILPAVKEDK